MVSPARTFLLSDSDCRYSATIAGLSSRLRAQVVVTVEGPMPHSWSQVQDQLLWSQRTQPISVLGNDRRMGCNIQGCMKDGGCKGFRTTGAIQSRLKCLQDPTHNAYRRRNDIKSAYHMPLSRSDSAPLIYPSLAAAEAKIEAEEDNDDNDENQESTNIKEEPIFSYDTMPRESLELDDNEFQIYAILRAWRQRRCKEITEEKGESFEPYMILPNRPICEIIRRKRNDPSWADPSADDDKQYSDLISTWGIGDAKAQDGGFGRQILEFIHEDNDILGLLQKSRTQKNKWQSRHCFTHGQSDLTDMGISKPHSWSHEQDQLLWSQRTQPISALASDRRLGCNIQGKGCMFSGCKGFRTTEAIKSRLKHLMDPTHKAYMRLNEDTKKARPKKGWNREYMAWGLSASFAANQGQHLYTTDAVQSGASFAAIQAQHLYNNAPSAFIGSGKRKRDRQSQDNEHDDFVQVLEELSAAEVLERRISDAYSRNEVIFIDDTSDHEGSILRRLSNRKEERSRSGEEERRKRGGEEERRRRGGGEKERRRGGEDEERSRGEEEESSRGEEEERSRGEEEEKWRGVKEERRRGQEVERRRGGEVKRWRGDKEERRRGQEVERRRGGEEERRRREGENKRRRGGEEERRREEEERWRGGEKERRRGREVERRREGEKERRRGREEERSRGGEVERRREEEKERWRGGEVERWR